MELAIESDYSSSISLLFFGPYQLSSDLCLPSFPAAYSHSSSIGKQLCLCSGQDPSISSAVHSFLWYFIYCLQNIHNKFSDVEKSHENCTEQIGRGEWNLGRVHSQCENCRLVQWTESDDRGLDLPFFQYLFVSGEMNSFSEIRIDSPIGSPRSSSSRVLCWISVRY